MPDYITRHWKSLETGSNETQYLIEERHSTCEKLKISDNGWLKNPYETLFCEDHKLFVYPNTKVNLCRKTLYRTMHTFQMEKGVTRKQKISVTCVENERKQCGIFRKER